MTMPVIESLLEQWFNGRLTGQEETEALFHIASELAVDMGTEHYTVQAALERAVRTCASQRLRENRDAMLAAVSVCSELFRSCSDSLRNDAEIAQAALRQDVRNVRQVGPQLWENRDFVLQAVQIYADALNFAPAFQSDRAVVLTAVQKAGFALRHACQELRDDREVVKSAIASNAQGFQYASKTLQADEEILMQALLRQKDEMRNSSMLRFAQPELKDNKDLVLLAIRMSYGEKGARHAYDQASASIKQEFKREEMQRIADCALACKGEVAPVLNVTISKLEGVGRSGDEDEQEDDEEDESDGESDGSNRGPVYSCEANLLSGTTIAFKISERTWGISPHRVTCADLATHLVARLSKHPEVEKTRRVHLLLVQDEGESAVVSPWCLDRPLADFALALASSAER